jgi:hypothetical protein
MRNWAHRTTVLKIGRTGPLYMRNWAYRSIVYEKLGAQVHCILEIGCTGPICMRNWAYRCISNRIDL